MRIFLAPQRDVFCPFSVSALARRFDIASDHGMEHDHHDAKAHGSTKDPKGTASAVGTPGKATQPQPGAGNVTANASKREGKEKETQAERIAKAGHDALHHANRLLDGIANQLLDPRETLELAQDAVDDAVNKCDIPALQKAVDRASHLLVLRWTRDAAKGAADMAKASKDLLDELREKDADKIKALTTFFNDVGGAVKDILDAATARHKDFQHIYSALDRAQALCGQLKPSAKLGSHHMKFSDTLQLRFNHGLLDGLGSQLAIPSLKPIGGIHVPGMRHIPGAQPLIPKPLSVPDGSVIATVA